ncbi:MAG: DEAD/DEAH box helicase [Candidatus Gastranaerophilales bacterium]|nr:DEAD/DEAH box helicase [Candidatus Gastranaerophilales bacterium]
MRINNTNLTQRAQHYQNKPFSRNKQNILFLSSSSLNYLPSTTFGRSIISFRGDSFEQTLVQNYFQLPINSETNSPYKPDEYQIKAAQSIYNGDDTLVTAPTGTGKTAIAYYAISKNMAEGKKTFYTTPLKALSNEKYKELKKIFGEENVGLLTGDKKEKADAPIVVMTAEIYRNMVIGRRFGNNSNQTDNLKTVIFDELHYLGDMDRGGIWEQSIIFSDENTQLLSLSATIGNNNTINDWISQVRGKQSNLIDVPKEARHVPLMFEILDVSPSKQYSKTSLPSEQSYFDMVKKLKKEDKLPAIFFIFSKKASRKLLDSFNKIGLNLNSAKEQDEVVEIIARYSREKYLGKSLNIDALKKGYAIHNSSLLPAQKELVEELFQKKLVKVVLATETLSAGINMPARTVVISSIRKPANAYSADGKDGKRELMPNEFHQMAGRAGRRGLDTIGYVYCMAVSNEQRDKLKILKDAQPNNIYSFLRPDYSFVAGCYKIDPEGNLVDIISNKSLRVYDEDPVNVKKKKERLAKVFENKKAILKEFDYMTEDNILTPKGELLSALNGYGQIPIIEMIYNKNLAGLTPVELSACAGSLISIEESRKDEDEEVKIFRYDSEPVRDFITILGGVLLNYNFVMSSQDQKYKEVEQNEDAANHLYTWAKLNEDDSDSLSNWEKLYNTYKEDADEGCLFKEITKTVDLLKQISKIAQVGLEIAETDEDKQYYSELKLTIRDTVKLLNRNPVGN